MSESTSRVIRTLDQRLRVFVSSTLQEVADERQAAREVIERLASVMFTLGALKPKCEWLLEQGRTPDDIMPATRAQRRRKNRS